MTQSFLKSAEWQRLIKMLKLGKKEPDFQPILWVGAGLSVSAGFPSTINLIEQLRGFTYDDLPAFNPWDPDLDENTPESSFTHWVQCFIEKNNSRHLTKALSNIFTKISGKPTPAHNALVKLPWKDLFTTNYDCLLEAALVHSEIPHNLITHEHNIGTQVSGISLYKIHGSINNFKEWTLDEKSYNSYPEQYPFLEGILKYSLFCNPIVFIGCSMIDPRLIDWYRLCKKQNELSELPISIVIIRKEDWLQLSNEYRSLYQEAQVRPLFFERFDELPSLIAALGTALNATEKSCELKIPISDAAERQKQEDQELDDLLYGTLAPRIVQTIANIWLKCDEGIDYLTKLESISTKAQKKGLLAFCSLEEDFVSLYKKRIGIKTDFSTKIRVFQAIYSQLEQFSPTQEALTRVKFDPHSLYGKWLMDHTPAEIFQADDKTEDLYKKILTETCELIVDCSRALPICSEATIVQQLEDPAALFEKLLQELQLWQETKETHMDEATLLEEEYRRAVTRRFDKLQIFGINFGKHARIYQLSVAYITLTTETNYSEKKTSEVLSTEEALTKFQRLVIIGDAGQGKTTLLQWLTVQCGRKAFTGSKKHWNKKVPILIKLREVLNNDRLPSASDFYSLMVENIGVEQQHQEWFNNLLVKGEAILMIDGFDEVPSARRNEILTWIDTFCHDYDDIQIILTTRPAVYDDVAATALAKFNFEVIRLQTMDLNTQQDFIEHWHKAIALEYDNNKPNALIHQSKALIQELNCQHALSSLAENPLLCSVICMLHHDRNGYLPKDRTDLYEASCRMLADSRGREKKVLEEEGFQLLDYPTKQSFLTDVAQWMSKEERTSISSEKLIERFTLKLNDLPKLKKQLSAQDLKSFFLERSGLLLQVGAREIQFAHRSFQEFFTAKYLIQERDWVTLKQNATNNYWHETIQLAVGLCQSKKENERFLDNLLSEAKKQTSNKQVTTLLYLLILRCKEAMREISPAFDSKIDTIIPEIIPPTSDSMENALAAAGELALPYLTRDENNSELADFHCAQVLQKINTLEAYRLLKDYLKREETDYIDSLCTTIKKMDIDTVKKSNLLQLMQEDGLTNFPCAITRKMAFLMQDSRFIAANSITKLSKKDFDDWELSLGFAPLAAFTQLKALYLENSQINDLRLLSGLTELQILYLHNTQINDLHPLSGLKKLQTLYLPNTQVNDLTPLSELDLLQTIDLRNTQINELTPLAGLTQLQTLNLTNTRIKDLTPLAGLPKLQTLYLANTHIKDLTPLSKLPQLQGVYLENTQVNDLKPLVKLDQLQTITLKNTKISNMSLFKKERPDCNVHI